MNRTQADIVAGVVIGSILVAGALAAAQFLLSDASMGPMESVPAMRAVGPLFMALLIASVVTGVYVFVRGRVFGTTVDESVTDGTTTPDGQHPTESEVETDPMDSAAYDDLLAVLPDDERRILEPVVESPGLTQIEVRDRSDFSKSKVSQTITDLEKRGLVYRESQGRTYRVYPADDLAARL